MKKDAFRFMAEAEASHWWFVGRRRFIEKALDSLGLDRSASILDAGCGSGGNLTMLAGFGKVYGFELDDDARAVAESRGMGQVSEGFLPDAIPFPGISFNVIGLFDVLEHLDEPVAALQALRERLTDDGRLILSVPAYQWLWGPHDEIHHHKRRYSRSLLARHLEAAGYQVEFISHFNTLLFPLALLQRTFERLTGRAGDLGSTLGPLNQTLLQIWSVERLWFGRVRVPFGLSIFAMATKSRS
jgi:SAM-dependent methyltransferase